jgi:uncharacterized repeat protein (TIGR03943 family)
MKIDARRARVAVVASWAAFFLVLWLTGASSRYLGARTQWLVPLGAVTLMLAAVLTWRSPTTRSPLRFGEGVGLLIVVLPVAATLLVPHAELGAYAAAHKSGGVFPQVKPAPPATPRDVTLLDIRVAEEDPTFALVSHIHKGTRVGLLGLVSATGRGRFTLTRFYITCCIADAQPLSIVVESPAVTRRDEWIWVTGTLRREPQHYELIADRVRPQRPPADPYLGFGT